MPGVVRVNLSSTFVIRCKCRYCGEGPDEYYCVNHMAYDLDPRSSQAVYVWFKKYVKQLIGFWYKKHQPSVFTNMRAFNIRWAEQSYKPTLHQHVGIQPYDTVTEYLSCPCGKSVWAFSQRQGDRRMEIRNRKARYKYPKKFDSF